MADPIKDFDTGTVSGMGGGGAAERVGRFNADLRARQIERDRVIGQEMARQSLYQRSMLEANRAGRIASQAFSPKIDPDQNFLRTVFNMREKTVGGPLFRNYGFGSIFRDKLPADALDQVWRTSSDIEMMPIWHGTGESIRPDIGWSPEHAVHRSKPSGEMLPNRGWYGHASHDPSVGNQFSHHSGYMALHGDTPTHAGDMPLSAYRRGFQYSPIFKEPEIRLSADDWNKAFQMGKYKDNPLARESVKAISSSRLARAIPIAGAALGAYDAGNRVALGDYAGAVLSGIGMIPGPIGWSGLGTQIAYDVIRAGINNGTLKTQQDIDEALGITGPPGIRGDY